MKPVIVGLVFLAALSVLIGLGVVSAVPVLSLGSLSTDSYDGGPVNVSNGQIHSIQSVAPLRFTVTPRGDPSLQIQVESTQSRPENFKAGNDVGITGRFDQDAKIFYAHAVTTKCPSRYEQSETLDRQRGVANPAPQGTAAYPK